jgi:hypothetical protein
MTNTNTDIEELEELLTELEGQEARLVTPYSEEDDAVTTQLEAPLNDQEWMVQVTALDRRMMNTELVVAEWRAGKISGKTLVWRSGMNDWTSIGSVAELRNARDAAAGTPLSSVVSQSAFPAPASVAPPAPPVARPASVALASAPAQSAPAWSGSATSPSLPAPSVPPPPAPAARLAPPPPTARPASITVPVNPAAANGKTLPSSAASATQPSFTPSQTNSMRPVAMDYPQESSARAGSKRLYIALGAVAIAAAGVLGLAVVGGDEKKVATASPEPKAAATQPQAVMGLNPASAEKKEAPAPAPVAKAEAAPAKPADDSASPTETASASMTGARSARSSNRYASKEYSASRRNKSAEPDTETEKPRAQAEPEQNDAPAAAAETEPAGDVEDGAVTQEDAPDDAKVASGGKRFDKEAAATVLKDAAEKAKLCRPKGGPTGNGRVRIRYEPSGKVSSVSIVTSKFDNTVAGSCVTMLFRRAQVPAFNGGAVVVNKEFEIP